MPLLLGETKLLPQVVNVATVPHRSLFRYPGGKTWLVPRIRQWLGSLGSKPDVFIEPFAGGGIVGLTVAIEGLASHTILVEIDEDVSAVWKVVLSPDADKLAARIMSFRISEESVREALVYEPKSTIDRAFTTILRNRVQRGGILAPGASLMKYGENGKGLASRWYPETLCKRIKRIAEHRHLISFIQGDGIGVIREQSRQSNAVFFIDPPYVIAGRRLYVHSDIDHSELFRVVSNVRGDFLMTYDSTDYVKELALEHGFVFREVAMRNTHNQTKHELLIGRNLAWFGDLDEFRPNSLFEDV